MIATEPTPATDPGKRALNDPSSGQRAKTGGKELLPVDFLSFRDEQAAFGHGERFDSLHSPTQVHFEPCDECTSIMAIAP